MPSCKDTLRYLYSLERHGIRPGLGRIKRLLALLGNPERRYPAVHVGGTNGKGSTSAMIFSVLREAGYPCGLYTSPHLIRFNERIRTHSGLISDKDIARTAWAVLKAAKEGGLEGEVSFFEFTTAMAFLYFAQKKVGVAVIEVGMGGRWDATNVLSPLVSVITNVGLDHTEFLGNSLKEIAFEKSGIIKKGVPAVTGADRGPALDVIKKAARERNSTLYVIGGSFRTRPLKAKAPAPVRFSYEGIEKKIEGLSVPLAGPHQLKNAACALATLELIGKSGFAVTERVVRAGLKKVSWPGRVEVAAKRPLVILDAAHNPEGARSLKGALRGFRYRRLILVMGIMADKDIGGILKELAPVADRIIAAAPKTPRAATPEALLERLKPYKKECSVERSVRAACRRAMDEARATDAVCVTGSIYTIGEAKGYISRAMKKENLP